MTTLLFLLVVAAVAWWLFRERQAKVRRLRQLVAEGVGVDAQITRRFERPLPKSRKVPYIEYRFTTATGEVLDQKLRVTRAEFERARPGDPIAIVYDPADPATNRPRSYLVDKGYL